MFNFCRNSKFAEDDSALDSISNLDNTSEYDDDFEIDNTYFKVTIVNLTLHCLSLLKKFFKNQDMDEVEPIEVVENLRFFNCNRDGVSWKQESTESEQKMDLKN